MPQLKIAEVAVLRRLPRRFGSFDYEIPPGATVSVADLVCLNFRGRAAYGLVTGLKGQTALPRARLKQLAEVRATAFLLPYQLELARSLAGSYGVYLGAVLELMVPVLPKQVIRYLQPASGGSGRSRRAAAWAVVTYTREPAGQEAVRSLLARVKARGQQTLLLVPEQADVENWLAALEAGSIGYTAKLRATAKRKLWGQLRSGETLTVVGTRASLFLPWANLGGVVVYREADDAFKQYDQNPRYDAVLVARELAHLTGASYASVSVAPRLETLAPAGVPVAVKTLPGAGRWRVRVVERSGERGTAARSLLAPSTVELTAATLAGGGRVILYLNRHGAETSYACRDCGFVPTCPTCARPLAKLGLAPGLRCYRCATEAPAPSPCPRCGSLGVRGRGGGLEQLVREVSAHWPNAVPGADQPEGSGQITLATRASLPPAAVAAAELLVLVAPDAELALPEFRAAERLWAHVRALAAFGPREVVVQTMQPDHYLWAALAAPVRTFVGAELRARRQLAYPPFSRLVRLTAEAVGHAAARRLAQAAAQALRQARFPHEVLGPYADYFRERRGRARYHLLLRCPVGFDGSRFWQYLPETVIVDSDPRSVLS